jgi:chromosome segregation ATPase
MLVLFSSCEYGREAEQKLNELNSQVEDFDSMINDGIEKVNELDSILPETNKRLKKADSIIKDASSTLDSLKQKVDRIENIFN